MFSMLVSDRSGYIRGVTLLTHGAGEVSVRERDL